MTTLQKVAEAIRDTPLKDKKIEGMKFGDASLYLPSHDYEAMAQAAISAYKQSDEWKGVVDALKGCRDALEYVPYGVSGIRDSKIDRQLNRANEALNKLNGGE